jgi:hypothetical protein
MRRFLCTRQNIQRLRTPAPAPLEPPMYSFTDFLVFNAKIAVAVAAFITITTPKSHHSVHSSYEECEEEEECEEDHDDDVEICR